MGGNVGTSDASSVEVVSLARSLRPVKDYFNQNKDKVRFVALLSPT
jgi:hypothetical protein